MDRVQVSIDKVLFDPKVGASVIMLKEVGGDRTLPIWIGQTEALSIAVAVESVALPRPMTHDLISAILERLDAKLSWVCVHAMEEGTFYAWLRLVVAGDAHDVDARPSDAVAIALRMDAPIFVANSVFAAATQIRHPTNGSVEQFDEDYLSELPDDVFGKYKM